MKISRLSYCVWVLLSLALIGCEGSSSQEVRQWMAETKKQVKIGVPIVVEPKKFVPFSYSGKSELDPFSAAKLAVVLAKQKSAVTSQFKPDFDRRKESLESYPLDSIKMVGTLQRKNLDYAVLQVDKSVFQVKLGNYVGQNFGMVTAINEAAVELKELVQDSSGEWVERKTKLELQESKK